MQCVLSYHIYLLTLHSKVVLHTMHHQQYHANVIQCKRLPSRVLPPSSWAIFLWKPRVVVCTSLGTCIWCLFHQNSSVVSEGYEKCGGGQGLRALHCYTFLSSSLTASYVLTSLPPFLTALIIIPTIGRTLILYCCCFFPQHVQYYMYSLASFPGLGTPGYEANVWPKLTLHV